MNGLQEVALHDVLLVEDSFADVVLMEEAFGATVKHLRLSRAEDGAEALSFLRREGAFRNAPRPKLVLLDLNMPRLNGFEVLAAMREEEALRSLPVLVLSTSQEDRDVERAYALGANAYLTKPHNLQGFLNLVRLIEGFWLTAARLPRGNGPVTRVLLVEDHFPDALLLVEWLELAGAEWEVVHVETFAEAARRCETEAFDALLLDLDIPDGFGLELLTRALALVGDLPLVVLSGLADDGRAAQALELGARAYVVKGQAAVQELLVALEGLGLGAAPQPS